MLKLHWTHIHETLIGITEYKLRGHQTAQKLFTCESLNLSCWRHHNPLKNIIPNLNTQLEIIITTHKHIINPYGRISRHSREVTLLCRIAFLTLTSNRPPTDFSLDYPNTLN